MHVWGARIASAFKVCLLLIWIANQINLLEVLLRATPNYVFNAFVGSSARANIQICWDLNIRSAPLFCTSNPALILCLHLILSISFCLIHIDLLKVLFLLEFQLELFTQNNLFKEISSSALFIWGKPILQHQMFRIVNKNFEHFQNELEQAEATIFYKSFSRCVCVIGGFLINATFHLL